MSTLKIMQTIQNDPGMKKKFEDLKCSNEEIESYAESFNYFDADGNGYIDESEMAEVLRASGLNPTERQVKKYMELVDQSKDGRVDFYDYAVICKKKCKGKEHLEQKLNRAFQVFDKDDSGYLEKTEMKRILTAMGHEALSKDDADSLIKLFDKDGDNKIKYSEFSKMMTIPISELNAMKDADH